MKRFILIFVFVLCSTFYVSRVSAQSKQSFYDAIIIDVKKNEVTVKFEEGPLKDKSVQVQTNSENQKNIEYRKGDSVVMTYEKNNKGASNVFIADFKRKNQLLVLLLLFLVVVFGIARFRGLLSLIGMMISFTMITRLIIPNILLGNDPVIVTLLASLFIIPITFFITHGVNKKTTIGIAATFLSLVLTGILATLFVNFAKLTGFAAEEAVYIQNIQGVSLNIKNILLAGIIIGAMGVLDDVTISQTSIVQKLREANKDFSFKELYKHAMDIGHDHIASLVNTLALVYAGASLPLFLLFFNANVSYSQVVNQEVVATEIVRTLVSSIGIIAAVPITTLIAVSFYSKR